MRWRVSRKPVLVFQRACDLVLDPRPRQVGQAWSSRRRLAGRLQPGRRSYRGRLLDIVLERERRAGFAADRWLEHAYDADLADRQNAVEQVEECGDDLRLIRDVARILECVLKCAVAGDDLDEVFAPASVVEVIVVADAERFLTVSLKLLLDPGRERFAELPCGMSRR